ncbi:uncharacterized protein RCC_05773 [Ramularia collo-cygni]|uniref:Uncharacterized protein n=1 Tax=Ramularia collo-cygni TaxID=112498 RepID=A0A2D3V8H8_9PEZI|nr:uncharacterized protein RCC_05773 [Ramularia collo-cygni]CZT19916.1 uncharacterized protein RCC_05773 [Ramularia collo-cygni]
MQSTADDIPRHIRLRITTTLKSQHDGVAIGEPSVWIPRFKTIDSRRSLSKLLPVDLKRYVEHYSAKDAAMSKHLADGSLITLSCTLYAPGDVVIPLDKDPRVDVLGDLTQDRHPEETVTIAAHLTLSLETRSKTKTLRTDTIERVHANSYLPTEEQQEWFRIGNVLIFEEDGKTQVIKRAARQHSECVAYAQPLLACLDPQTGKFQMSSMHAYDFIDFVVGDPKDRKMRNSPGSNSHFLGTFAHVVWTQRDWRSRFSESFSEYLAQREEGDTMSSGVPFLPTFCYNTFHAEDSERRKKWPENGIDFAVRCVNHYADTSDLKFVEFPRDIRLSIWAHETMETLCEDVAESINVAGLFDEVEVNSKKLFDRKHQGKWVMEFWVMPQRQKKMYRYTQGKLNQFLDYTSDFTRSMDKRLYCEAHIVAKEE